MTLILVIIYFINIQFILFIPFIRGYVSRVIYLCLRYPSTRWTNKTISRNQHTHTHKNDLTSKKQLSNKNVATNIITRLNILPTQRVPSRAYCLSTRMAKNQGDGGYILADLPGVKPYDLIISCGIANEDSFTRDATQKYKCTSLGFDGTITEYPHEFIVPEYPITFHRKNIAATNSADTTNLTEYLRTHRDILVKMDIESHEYKWLLGLSDTELRSIKQITLEIHQYTYDIIHKPTGQSVSHIRFQDKLRALQKIARNFVLIHAHPNNNGTILNIDGHPISDLVELTYVRRNEFKSQTGLIPSTEPLPVLGLDFPNVPDKPDIDINFPPFVNPSTAIGNPSN